VEIVGRVDGNGRSRVVERRGACWYLGSISGGGVGEWIDGQLGLLFFKMLAVADRG
jgi:hypothetical protein